MVSYQTELLEELDGLLRIEFHELTYAQFEGLRFVASELAYLLKNQEDCDVHSDQRVD